MQKEIKRAKDQLPVRQPQISMPKNPDILQAVKRVLEKISSPQMTIKDVEKGVVVELGDSRQVPGSGVIRTILKETFLLRYRSARGELYRYNDPRFDNKRLWVCRLLA